MSWLLEMYPNDAILVPLSFSMSSNSLGKKQNEMISEGLLPGTIRFLPGTSSSASDGEPGCALFGGGFFLAKLLKNR